jgi:outer membrane protein TolC
MNDTARLTAVPIVALLLLSASDAGAQAAAPAEARAGAPAARRGIALDDVIVHALKNNPTLAAADLGVAQARQNVRAEEGRYPYVFQADAGYSRMTSLRLLEGDTLISSRMHTYTLGSALRRTFPLGTTAEVRVEGERLQRDAADTLGFTSAGASYGVSARASVTQPLLRGAGRRVGELELRAARENQTLNEKGRTRVKSGLVRDAIVAYWELWYAGEAIGIERAALRLAERQEADARAQIAAGDLAPADVLTFSTRVAQLEEAAVAAEVQERQRALELARIMGTKPGGADALAANTDPPVPAPSTTRAAVEASIRAGSVELAELESQVRIARTRSEVAGESSRPALDVEGYVETTGLSERVSRAAERAGRLKWTTAQVNLVFELPLDDTRRSAERASAALAVRIAEQNLRAARERVAAEAALVVTTEAAAIRRVALAEKTLAVAEKTYQAERARFELGESIPIQVQEAEEDMRRARLSVARARVDLAQAQADVRHLTGELLPRYDRPRNAPLQR